MAEHVGARVTILTYDRREPADGWWVIRDFVRNFERVSIDISGMSRLLIVQMIVGLMQMADQGIRLFYSEALEYLPTDEEFRTRQTESPAEQAQSYLSSGIFEIAATPELSAVAMLGAPVRLIAFPSFDPAQLLHVLQEVQPTYTDVIHGVPPLSENRWRTDAIETLNRGVLSEMAEMRGYRVSTMDYGRTLRILAEVYSERSVFDRIVVAPTGSKLQAVAVGVFRAALDDIQIVYPIPQEFASASNYTRGVRDVYEVNVPQVGRLERGDEE